MRRATEARHHARTALWIEKVRDITIGNARLGAARDERPRSGGRYRDLKGEKMMRTVFGASVAMALGVAACSSPPRPGPPVWSADYAVPFDTMVNCLTSTPAGALTVGQPVAGFGGVVRLSFIPSNAPQANSYYVLQHLPNNGTQVNWYRANDVMGLDWLDAAARTRSDGCGGVPYQAAAR
jgi:hypothetical protein